MRGNFLIDNYSVVIVNKAHLNDITKYKYSDGYKAPRPQQIIRVNGAYNHVDWKSQKVCKRHVVKKYAISIGTKNSDHLKSNEMLHNLFLRILFSGGNCTFYTSDNCFPLTDFNLNILS